VDFLDLVTRSKYHCSDRVIQGTAFGKITAVVLIALAVPLQAAAFQHSDNTSVALIAEGIAMMRSGQFKEASSALREAVRLDPSSVAAHYNLALALLRLSDESEAAAELKKATVLAPKLVAAHYNLALLLEHSGKLTEAIEQLQAVRALEPGDAAALTHLVQDEFKTGASGQALEAAREALAQSSDPRFKAGLGVLLVQNGHASDAIEPLETAVRSTPDAVSIMPYLARAYMETGHPEQATVLLREAVKLAPDTSEVHFNLGRMLLRSSTAELQRQGLDEMETAIRLSPHSSEYYEELGRLLLEKGQVEQASSVLKRGLEQAAGSVNMNLLLGVAEADLQGSQAAKPYVEKALALDPHAALAYNLLGNLSLRVGNYEDALRNYRKAMELSPTNDLYAYDVALALERMNRLDDAIPYAEKSVRLKPDRGITHYMLGKLYAKANRNDDAIRELETCIWLDPQADQCYYVLSRIYKTLGDGLRAEQWSARFRELKAARDRRVGLASPASESSSLLTAPALWDQAR
jgi:tetratricopeptide (TPR) repeat protein